MKWSLLHLYRTLAWWLECLPMARETWVQSQVESYQSLKKWCLMPPCLTQYYRVRIKGKMEQSRERSSAFTYSLVLYLSIREPSGHLRLWSPTSLLHVHSHIWYVIYWPSTEPSVKRCPCVNKRKNSGSRWVLGNNISRCPGGSSSVETGMPKWEPAGRLRALGPQWLTVEQPQPRWRWSVTMVNRRTWVNIALGLCLNSSLTHNRTSPFQK